MKLLLVHPSSLMYSEIYLRLEPLGLELIAEACRRAGHDDSELEPTVLPAKFPQLLVNGSGGIAVGMATNIPPHNLGEVVEGLIALIDRPQLSDAELFALIPGPDFPTGGEIIGTEGIYEAYRTGRGSIPIRGVSQFEEVRPGKGRQRRNAIVVTELPYQVNKAG